MAAVPVAAAAARSVVAAGTAGTDDAWLALCGIMLWGFTPTPREQAYQLWKQQRVRQVTALALWVQSTIILLPSAALLLYALVWLRGGGTLAALAFLGSQIVAAHVPALVYWWRPRLYLRHHDLLWALTSALSAVFMSACWSSGVMAFLKEAGAGSLLRNMLMPAILVYIVLPALLRRAPGWQLVIGVIGYFSISSVAGMAADSASIGIATHVALVALSVAITFGMEWRSRARWLRSSRASPARPGLAVPLSWGAGGLADAQAKQAAGKA